MSDPTVAQPQTEPLPEIPEVIRRSLAALRRDLPMLLGSWWKRGKWVCYAGDEWIGVSRDYLELVREVIRRDIPDTGYVIERIAPGAGSKDEEDVTR